MRVLRDKVIGFAPSPEQNIWLRKQSAEAGLTLSEVIRQAIDLARLQVAQGVSFPQNGDDSLDGRQ